MSQRLDDDRSAPVSNERAGRFPRGIGMERLSPWRPRFSSPRRPPARVALLLTTQIPGLPWLILLHLSGVLSFLAAAFVMAADSVTIRRSPTITDLAPSVFIPVRVAECDIGCAMGRLVPS
ncbi:hypothetical protein C8R46DRAFT_1047388 [Mycena filopes]|nr:hypothetical protein C8R46DRAFT_1047388 [Mycena filopes]